MSDEIAVKAHIEHKETQSPCRVHVIKNWVAEGFMVLNLLSSPSLCTLINKKLPSLSAHRLIRNTSAIFAPFKFEKLLDEKYNENHITVK